MRGISPGLRLRFAGGTTTIEQRPGQTYRVKKQRLARVLQADILPQDQMPRTIRPHAVRTIREVSQASLRRMVDQHKLGIIEESADISAYLSILASNHSGALKAANVRAFKSLADDLLENPSRQAFGELMDRARGQVSEKDVQTLAQYFPMPLLDPAQRDQLLADSLAVAYASFSIRTHLDFPVADAHPKVINTNLLDEVDEFIENVDTLKPLQDPLTKARLTRLSSKLRRETEAYIQHRDPEHCKKASNTLVSLVQAALGNNTLQLERLFRFFVKKNTGRNEYFFLNQEQGYEEGKKHTKPLEQLMEASPAFLSSYPNN